MTFRKNIILGLLLLSTIVLQAQESGTAQLEAVCEADYLWLEDEYRITTGPTFNYWITDNVGLNYSFQVGYDSRYDFQFNTGWGQILAYYLLDLFDNEVGYLTALSIIIPEGVSVAVPVNKIATLIIYCNPLEADYMQYDNPRLRCAGEFGVKPQIHLGHGISVRPKIGMRYQYSKQRLGVTIGLGVVFLDSSKQNIR